MKYRFLTEEDRISHGDEFLPGDSKTWEKVDKDGEGRHFIGSRYNPGIFVPMRRRVEIEAQG